MVELTKWADGLLAPLADRSGIPREFYSIATAGQFIATIIEDIYDLVTKGWFNVFMHLLTGVLATGYATFSKSRNLRLKEELLVIGANEFMHLLSISKWKEASASFKEFLGHVKSGNYRLALSTMFKTPSEMKASLGLGSSAPAPTPAPTEEQGGEVIVVQPPPAPPAPSITVNARVI